jgi:phage/plasmid-like protein (TIGR03299 family)
MKITLDIPQKLSYISTNKQIRRDKMKTAEIHEVANCKSANEVLAITNNMWKTEQSPIFDQFGNKINTHKAILRTDDGSCLGVVGKDYTPMELEESFSIFDSLLADERATMDSLKVFENGKKVVYTTNLQSFEVQNNDRLVPKMHILQSFDGSKAYQVFFTAYRLVCKNGLVMLSEKSIMNIRHTVSLPERAKFAEVALEKAFTYFDGMKQVMFDMVKTKINEEYANAVLDQVIGKSIDENGKYKTRTINIKDAILNLYMNGQGNNGETKWDLYNGISEFVTHERGNEDNREFSNLMGSGYIMNQNAFKIISTMAA